VSQGVTHCQDIYQQQVPCQEATPRLLAENYTLHTMRKGGVGGGQP